jgi:hypothetical protein
MACAWSGTVREFKQLAASGDLVDRLRDGLAAFYGQASAIEQMAWQESLTKLAETLASPDFDLAQIIIEMQCQSVLNEPT